LSEAAKQLAAYLKRRGLDGGGPDLGFVGHSAGGVLLRYLAAELPGFRAGRSVALGSPLAGSAIAQHYSSKRWAQVVCGPILQSLHPEEVEKLPPPPCPLGSIAGTAQATFLPAAFLLRPIAGGRPSDATVLVENTHLADNLDHIEVPVIHTLLPIDKTVHKLVSRFLAQGSFKS
jgi:pimeloyl-ACP methyl ester carboxylesterase